MMNQAYGFLCVCGSDGPHNIHDWLFDGPHVAGFTLSCHSCEAVFEVTWRQRENR